MELAKNIEHEHDSQFEGARNAQHEPLDVGRVDLENTSLTELLDLVESLDSVSNNHHVVVLGEQILKLVDDVFPVNQVRGNFVHLGHTHDSSFPHIRVLVFKTFLQRGNQIFVELGHTQTAHSSQSQGSDKGTFPVFHVLN